MHEALLGLKTHMRWILPPDESRRESQKWMTSCVEATNGLNVSTTRPIGLINFNQRNQGRSSVIVVEMRDILLAIVHRNPHQTRVVHGLDKHNATLDRDPVEPVKIGRKNKKNPPM